MHWLQVLVGLFGGAFGGAGLQGWLDRRHASEEADKQRGHTTNEARAVRRYETRRDAYVAQSAHLEKVRLIVTLTEPIWNTGAEPPTIELDEEWIRLGGLVSVSNSDAVREVSSLAITEVSNFNVAVAELQAEVEKGRTQNPAVVYKARLNLMNARQRVIAAIENAQTVMRDELDSL